MCVYIYTSNINCGLLNEVRVARHFISLKQGLVNPGLKRNKGDPIGYSSPKNIKGRAFKK